MKKLYSSWQYLVRSSVIVVFFGIYFFSGFSFADGTETGNIKGIIVEGSGANVNISVWIDGTDYKAECGGSGRWTLHSTDVAYKEKYAALMSAAATGKQVSLYYSTGMGCGGWNSLKIYYVHTVF